MAIMKIGVNRRKTKYMEIGHHQGMIANEHSRIGSNSYKKAKPLNMYIKGKPGKVK
jgi:hypothetical protein